MFRCAKWKLLANNNSGVDILYTKFNSHFHSLHGTKPCELRWTLVPALLIDVHHHRVAKTATSKNGRCPILLCYVRMRACYEKREHIWLVQAKKIPNVLLINRETPGKSVELATLPSHCCAEWGIIIYTLLVIAHILKKGKQKSNPKAATFQGKTAVLGGIWTGDLQLAFSTEALAI